MKRTIMIRSMAGLGLAVGLAITATACSSGSTGTSSGATRVAFLNGGTVTAYNTAEADAVAATIAPAGYTLDVQSADYDPSRQLTQCDTVVASGDYAGIVIVPAVGAAATPCVTKAAAAGIPIVSLETQIGPELWGENGIQVEGLSGQVYHDTRVLVKQWAGMAKEACADRTPCHVGVVQGDPAYPDQSIGLETFQQELASDPNIQITGTVVGGFSNPDGGISAAQNLLQVDPDLDVIAVFDDETATGTVAELERQGKTDVRVIGFGGPQVAIDRIKAGTQFGTIAFFAKSTAVAAANMLLAAINGQPVEPNSIESSTLSPLGNGSAAITSANVNSYTPEY